MNPTIIHMVKIEAQIADIVVTVTIPRRQYEAFVYIAHAMEGRKVMFIKHVRDMLGLTLRESAAIVKAIHHEVGISDEFGLNPPPAN